MRTTIQAARRLFAASKPIWGTPAQTYLHARGLADLSNCEALRFHPRCFYRTGALLEARPALIAAITDIAFNLTGVHRTFLHPSGTCKARIAEPRRTLGRLLGHGVRFGFPRGATIVVMAAGEGIETMLSVRRAAPALPLLAALSASHLSAIAFPPSLKRLYIALDNDRAGLHAARVLTERARSAGIDAMTLAPRLDDFNDDLRAFGADRLRTILRDQFAPEDAARFLDL